MPGLQDECSRAETETSLRYYVNYQSLRATAGFTIQHLTEAWQRPVRHDRRIERAALWSALGVTTNCGEIISADGWFEHVRRATGDATARYDVETAIRTLPTILPYTASERALLNRNKKTTPRNLQFYHGIGDTALGQDDLLERWYEWIWSPPEIPSSRRASPSPAAEVLVAGCNSLAGALGAISIAHEP